MASTTPTPRSIKPETDDDVRASGRSSNGRRDRLTTTTTMIGDAAGAAATAASDAASRLPGAFDRSTTAFVEANRLIRAGSDEALSAGTALSFGFVMGLFVGGAGRLLVAAAMVPLAMFGFALFERTLAARSTGISGGASGR